MEQSLGVAKLTRLKEAWHVLRHHSSSSASWRPLIGAYSSTLRSATDQSLIDVELEIAGRGFPVRMRNSDIYTVAEILHERQYALKSTLPRQPVIIDAGSNIGISALWFLACYPDAQLIVFEPGSGNFELLAHNVGTYQNVTLEQAALGIEEGKMQLNLSSHGAMHSVKVVEDHIGSEPAVAVRLDSYLAGSGIERVHLLKLDVEGSELDALRGLGERIRAVEVIVGEVHEDLIDEAEFYEFLAAHGFRVVQKRRFDSSADDRVHMFEVSRSAP